MKLRVLLSAELRETAVKNLELGNEVWELVPIVPEYRSSGILPAVPVVVGRVVSTSPDYEAGASRISFDGPSGYRYVTLDFEDTVLVMVHR